MTNDLISRKRVCDYIAEFINHEYSTQSEREMVDLMIKGIQHMPSVSEKSERDELLDKIKAKMLEEKECAYADFERYKVEYLGQDWDDVYDSLPQDDFRYGMERCIEIIDRYRNGVNE